MFGKLMSVSDDMMWRYWLLLTDRDAADVDALRAEVGEGRRHPMEVKKELARTLVSEFHSQEAAAGAQSEFERVFSSRQLPEDIPELEVAVDGADLLVSKMLVQAGLASSNAEARRLLEQGGVRLGGETCRDVRAVVGVTGAEPLLVQVGRRRFARVRLVG